MEADRKHPTRTRHEINRLIRNLTRDHVEAALRRLQAGESTPFSESTTYDVEYNSGKYPPKRVVGLALEELTGEKFTPYDFIGGVFSTSFRHLEDLRFRIVDKQGQVRGSNRREGKSRGKYGQLTWQIVLDAVQAHKDGATKQEVTTYLSEARPEFNLSNVDPDLSMLTVNSPSRGNFHPNREPRRCDSGNRYDALFRTGEGSEAKYVTYDPATHGTWELAQFLGDDVLRPHLLERDFGVDFRNAQREAADRGDFDACDTADARKRVLAAIVRRQGQPAFRRALMAAYGGRCAITGCEEPATLEAAHIAPYLGPQTNHVQNGLLLRADIHTLFDLRLLRIDPATMCIRLAHDIGEHYQLLEGCKLRLPEDRSDWPSTEALAAHFTDWQVLSS